MIRITAILLILIGFLAGCSDGNSNSSSSAPPAEETPLSPQEVIALAGNTEDEKERYELLLELSGTPDLGSLQADLDTLLPVIERWAHGRERFWVPGENENPAEGGYLSDFQWDYVENGGDYPPAIAEDSPLYPVWALYKGRVQIWLEIENGISETLFEQGIEHLQTAAAAFPDNAVIGMYLGMPTTWAGKYTADADAPDWANAQREALAKVVEIYDYWVAERQAPDGQFGGGWGDDVEMWRNFIPLLIGFRSDDRQEAWEKLSNSLWELERMAGGYTSISTDVEHSAEDSGDTITSMLLMDPDSSTWTQRALKLAELMEGSWTARNDKDALQFASTYITSAGAETEVDFACDTNYHARAIQPALLHWLRNPENAQLANLFSDWMSTWVDVSASQDNGKPAGVIPSSIQWPYGTPGGPGTDDWWDPGCHTDKNTFAFPKFLASFSTSMVQTYFITGDEQYLAPIASMADIRRALLQDPEADTSVKGSPMWVADKMGSRMGESLAKYWMLSGDEQFNDLLVEDAGSYVRALVNDDFSELTTKLQDLVAAYSMNREAFTSEVRFTDRIFKFNTRFYNDYFSPEIANPDTGILYQMITGDVGDAQYLPLNGIRWGTAPEDIAILVTRNATSGLMAQIYHFGESSRSLSAELFLLAPGEYSWAVGSENTEVDGGTITVTAEGERVNVELTLPAKGLYEFNVNATP